MRACILFVCVLFMLAGCGGQGEKGGNLIKKDPHKDESKERPGPPPK